MAKRKNPSKDLGNEIRHETNDNISDGSIETVKKNTEEENQNAKLQAISLDPLLEEALKKIFEGFNKLTEKQESFEKQCQDVINKQTLAIQEIQKEFMHLNKPVETATDEFSSAAPTASNGSMIVSEHIDKDGINWGGTLKKKDEFTKQNKTGNQLIDSLGIPPDAIANVIGKVIDSILNKPQNQGNIGSVFQELMLRNFMEDLQYTKMIQKAQMQTLFKRDLIDATDLAKVKQNTDILNDPLNSVIEKMRNPQS